MIRTLLAVAALLVGACNAGPAATSAPTAGPPTVSAMPLSTLPSPTPSAEATLELTPEATPAAGPYCDPAYDDCEDKYTPRPQETSAATVDPGAEDVDVAVSDGHLVDDEGMSLYIFDNDSEGESACYDSCAENWPPMQAGDKSVSGGEGVTGTLSSSTYERPDGNHQVLYDGAPLYYYSGDSEPGDTIGDGVGDVWHLARP